MKRENTLSSWETEQSPQFSSQSFLWFPLRSLSRFSKQFAASVSPNAKQIMGIYNRCKLIPCKQCWRSLQEGVSVSQTQKPFNHTFGRKKQIFSQQELQPFLHSQEKSATERTPCTRGVFRPWDWMCRRNPKGLGVVMARFYFQQRFYISCRGSWKASLLQLNLTKPKRDSCSSCGSHPNWGSLDSVSEKWEQREGKRKDELHKAVHKSFFFRAGHKNTLICFSMK